MSFQKFMPRFCKVSVADVTVAWQGKKYSSASEIAYESGLAGDDGLKLFGSATDDGNSLDNVLARGLISHDGVDGPGLPAALVGAVENS